MKFFDNLKKAVKEMQRMTDEHHTSMGVSFNDPIAMQTEWKPLSQSGSNFATHSLIMIDENRLEFKATSGAKFLYFAVLIMILGIIIALIFVGASSLRGAFFFTIVFIFPLVGFLLFYFRTKSIVFDRKKGHYWNGKKPPKPTLNTAPSEKYALFQQIYALQLLEKTWRSNSSSTSSKNRTYQSYEINLVLNDGRRINVISHGDKKKLIKDTATLAKFLDKPIWNAIDYAKLQPVFRM